MLRRLASVLGVLAILVLSGCAGTVHLEPADDANNPLCAEVTVRLPQAIADQERRWTDAQATGSWGDPVSVLLSCGVTVPGPTFAACRRKYPRVQSPDTDSAWKGACSGSVT